MEKDDDEDGGCGWGCSGDEGRLLLSEWIACIYDISKQGTFVVKEKENSTIQTHVNETSRSDLFTTLSLPHSPPPALPPPTPFRAPSYARSTPVLVNETWQNWVHRSFYFLIKENVYLNLKRSVHQNV